MITKPIVTLEYAIFTVVCLVTWPVNSSEAGVALALIQTSLLFHSNAIYFFTMGYHIDVVVKFATIGDLLTCAGWDLGCWQDQLC